MVSSCWRVLKTLLRRISVKGQRADSCPSEAAQRRELMGATLATVQAVLGRLTVTRSTECSDILD